MQCADHQSLKQLVQSPKPNIKQILTHPELIFTMKNQDPILKQIFTKQNTKIMLSYLNREHQLDTNNRELSYKLPQAVMEILCCESHLLTEVIFESEKEAMTNKNAQEHQSGQEEGQREKQTEVEKVGKEIEDKEGRENIGLLSFLLQYLDYRQHYYLTGFFSKVMGSLTKRVFSPNHKYNQILCDKVFKNGNQIQSACLFKTLNHMYSQSINDLIVRWLTLKGKQDTYLQQKQQFLQTIVSLINLSEDEQPPGYIKSFSSQILESCNSLILQLLKSALEPAPERPVQQPQQSSSLLLNKNTQKQLYSLFCKQKYILQVLKPVPNPRVQKIVLMKKIIKQYRIENEQVSKMEQQYRQIRLANVVNEEVLVEGLGWLNGMIAVEVGITGEEDIGLGNQETQELETNARQENKVEEKKINKKKMVAYLELLHEYHLLTEQLRQPLTFFYEQPQNKIIPILHALLCKKTNIISTVLSKVIKLVLTKLECPTFVTNLLKNCIAKLIEQKQVKEHILEWGKIILENKKEIGHIYENFQEEREWDKVIEAVQGSTNADDFAKGKGLAQFYSLDKAKQYYMEFLSQPIIIEYEEKINLKRTQSQKQDKSESKPLLKKAQSLTQGNQQNQLILINEDAANIQLDDPKTEAQTQAKMQEQTSTSAKLQKKFEDQLALEEPELDVFGIDCIRAGYIKYEIDSLIEDLL